MIISFFEEFPTKKNLKKIKLISWPSKLYLAARSVKEFNKIKSEIKNKNIKEIIYWPILEQKEGYWISPFSKRSALLRIFKELEEEDISVMIDSELPTTRNPVLYLTESHNFFRNRKLIGNIVKNKQSYSAEYYPSGKIKEKVMSFLGIHFDSNKFKNKVIKMIYHSMHDFDKEFITNKIREGREEFGDNFLVAYGTIAKGVLGDEKILSHEQLNEDLRIAKKCGVKEIVIFRLGGLNKEFVEAIKTNI